MFMDVSRLFSDSFLGGYDQGQPGSREALDNPACDGGPWL